MYTPETRGAPWRLALCLVFVVGVLCFVAPGGVSAQEPNAEAVVVGSDGLVDEADISRHEFRNQLATMKDSVASGVVTYRYPLRATADFQDCNNCAYDVRIRYRDTGPNQRVVVRVKAALLTGDGVETVYTFDSNAVGAPPASNLNQTFIGSFIAPFNHITHGTYSYFLEVELSKTANDNTQSPGFIGFAISEVPVNGGPEPR